MSVYTRAHKWTADWKATGIGERQQRKRQASKTEKVKEKTQQATNSNHHRCHHRRVHVYGWRLCVFFYSSRLLPPHSVRDIFSVLLPPVHTGVVSVYSGICSFGCFVEAALFIVIYRCVLFFLLLLLLSNVRARNLCRTVVGRPVGSASGNANNVALFISDSPAFDCRNGKSLSMNARARCVCVYRSR